MTYRVLVEDNHTASLGKALQWTLGEFGTAEEACEAAAKVIDEFMRVQLECSHSIKGLTGKRLAAELTLRYMQGGELPHIIGDPGDPVVLFSSLEYVKHRVCDLAGLPPPRSVPLTPE